jgi:hypothetical protein
MSPVSGKASEPVSERGLPGDDFGQALPSPRTARDCVTEANLKTVSEKVGEPVSGRGLRSPTHRLTHSPTHGPTATR